jgi:hypothetical protein
MTIPDIQVLVSGNWELLFCKVIMQIRNTMWIFILILFAAAHVFAQDLFWSGGREGIAPDPSIKPDCNTYDWPDYPLGG